VVFASVGGRGLTSLDTWVQTNWYKHWLVVVSTHGKITGVPNKQGLVFCTDKKYTSIKVCNKDERGTKIIFWTDNQCTFYIPKKTKNNFYSIFLCVVWTMAISTKFWLYSGSQFYWWRKPECPEKTTDLSQVTDKTFSHNVVSSTPHHERDLKLQL